MVRAGRVVPLFGYHVGARYRGEVIDATESNPPSTERRFEEHGRSEPGLTRFDADRSLRSFSHGSRGCIVDVAVDATDAICVDDPDFEYRMTRPPAMREGETRGARECGDREGSSSGQQAPREEARGLLGPQ
jgi:hypothetical protein